MKKIKVAEASNTQLDWLVARCEGLHGHIKSDGVVYTNPNGTWYHNWRPSIFWSQMGPIIEREKINCGYDRLWIYDPDDPEDNGERAYAEDVSMNNGMYGSTILVAAARCYVVSKLGEEVEIPEGLV